MDHDQVLAAVRAPDRREALRRTDLLDTGAEPAFDRLTRLVQRVLEVPTSFLSLGDEDRQFYKSCVGLGPELTEARERVREAMAEQIEGDYDETYRVVTPDDEVKWVRDRAFPVQAGDPEARTRIVGIAYDVTREVAYREELEEGALAEVVAEAGRQFDPEVAAVFLEHGPGMVRDLDE